MGFSEKLPKILVLEAEKSSQFFILSMQKEIVPARLDNIIIS